MPAKRCHCGEVCLEEGRNPAEPCWGEVHPVEELLEEDGRLSGQYLHACSGHADLLTANGPYKADPGTVV